MHDLPQLLGLNGLMLYANDVGASLLHYEKLGFEIIQDQAPTYGSVRLDNFLIQFQDKHNPTDQDFRTEAMAEPKGAGLFVYIQVEDADAYYEAIKERGVTPATQPRDWPHGLREFVVRDLDGYKLVFYQPIQVSSQEFEQV